MVFFVHIENENICESLKKENNIILTKVAEIDSKFKDLDDELLKIDACNEKLVDLEKKLDGNDDLIKQIDEKGNIIQDLEKKLKTLKINLLKKMILLKNSLRK